LGPNGEEEVNAEEVYSLPFSQGWTTLAGGTVTQTDETEMVKDSENGA
jgi:hypothetical protein